MSSSAPFDSSAHKARSRVEAGSGSKRNDSLKRRRQQSPPGNKKLDDSKTVVIRNMGDNNKSGLPLPPLVSRIPGLNERLNYVPPNRRLVPHAPVFDNGCCLRLTTIREFRMLQFMNEVTDKDNWHVKIMNDDIANQWIREVQEQQPTTFDTFSDRMAQYCLSELRWKAKEYKRTSGSVVVYNGDVVKSDVAISTDLQSRLQEAVGKLEASIVQMDYHPNSEEQVWDLVDPSLFPLVYGKSRILRDKVVGRNDCLKYMACGDVIPEPTENPCSYSQKFQWLPCDVHLNTTPHNGDDTTTSTTTTTTTCQITSYINNLHPQRHADLYAVLADIIAAAIPLWNASLRTGLVPEEEQHPLQRITYTSCEYDPLPWELEDFPDKDLYWEDQDAWEGHHEEWMAGAWQRCLVYPEPDDFQEPPDQPTTNILVERFAATGLQVIVKLTTIELTPDKPIYGGSAWNVEGQLNEHICATALYTYSTENIAESHIGFRQISGEGEVASDIVDEQGDDRWLEHIFGSEGDCFISGAFNQDIGTVCCKEGRVVTFPSTLLHRVRSFELADKTRPGHHKMLVFFLVDPNVHILSTARVPPQRLDWWYDSSASAAISSLSNELQQHILSMLDFPMNTETAESLRLELVEERQYPI